MPYCHRCGDPNATPLLSATTPRRLRLIAYSVLVNDTLSTFKIVMVEELTSQFSRCQQLLNSISGTISSKSSVSSANFFV
ncbi:hypothetical protein PR202_gb29416 [Eleusine coracana subsp. coracana]|uniref:Uncharacterized protein n=1 Tax=Eleusine coracana subsp. coracana TaxID=191504 RepID=A0AAV5FZ09_ELECO|nr:hypothetical protein PR202_gb29416 [Eleusine coracana subsp. coracana]